MQNFELTILGCSSATPTSKRNPTAQLLNIAERFFLIDCGEGTQIQLRKFKIKFSSFEKFVKELESGKLKWGSLHTTSFWEDNYKDFEFFTSKKQKL